MPSHRSKQRAGYFADPCADVPDYVRSCLTGGTYEAPRPGSAAAQEVVKRAGAKLKADAEALKKRGVVVSKAAPAEPTPVTPTAVAVRRCSEPGCGAELPDRPATQRGGRLPSKCEAHLSPATRGTRSQRARAVAARTGAA